MSQFEYYSVLDTHPFTGLRKLSVPFKARIKDNEHIRKFFNGTQDVEQVENATIGKVYEIHAVEGYGDAADFIFTDDTGKEASLGDFFRQFYIRYPGYGKTAGLLRNGKTGSKNGVSGKCH